MKLQTIKGTPFATYEIEDGKFIIVFGDAKISNSVFSSHKEACNYTGRKPWELIINSTVATVLNVLKNENKENKDANKATETK